MRPFATDEQLAQRVRAVARELHRRDSAPRGVLAALALELENVALILDPEHAPAVTPRSVAQRLPGV